MLRHLYKTLIISIMCGSLSIMNMTAFAQEAGAGTSSSATTTKATPSNSVKRDANGVYTKTDKHSFDKIEDSDMIASITMLATGVIAGRMAASYRPITTDVMIAAAGGAAFIAGEVMSNMAFKKKMEEMTAEVTKSSDGKLDQAQIQRLEDLKKSYQEAKKTTSTKKTLQMGAAAAFAIAAGTAIYLATQEDAMDAACAGAVQVAQKGLASCVSSGATGVGATEAAGCGECIGELATYFSTYKIVDTKSKIPAPSLAKEASLKPVEAKLQIPPCQATPSATAKAIISGVTGACSPAIKFKLLNQTSADPKLVKVDNGNKLLNEILFGGQRAVAHNYQNWQSNEKNNIFHKILNLMFPKAQASWLPLLGLGVSSIVAFTAITGSLGVAIDTQMYVPTNRAIAFGVLGGLSYLAANSSQSQMDKIDKNIEKIDAILKDMNALQNGIKTNTINERQIHMAGFKSNNQADYQLSTNPAVKTDCATSSGSSNCTTMTDQLKAMPGFSDLPDSFKNLATQSAKMGDGLSGTNSISGSTLSTAANLGSKQNAIAKLVAKSQKRLNDSLIANGKSPIDFNKEQSKFLAKLNNETAKSLRSGGMSAGAFLSSIGGTPVQGASKASSGPEVAASKKLPISASGAIIPSDIKKDKAFDLDFKEEGAAEAGFASTGDGSAATKEEVYDIGQNDINTNSNESIFQMISNRYIKSGYPKLLEEEPVKN